MLRASITIQTITYKYASLVNDSLLSTGLSVQNIRISKVSLVGCALEGTSKLKGPQIKFIIRLGPEEESRHSHICFPPQCLILVNGILLSKPKHWELTSSSSPHVESVIKPCHMYLPRSSPVRHISSVLLSSLSSSTGITAKAS